MSQNRRGSLLEACVNTVAGYVIGVVSQQLLFPLFGVHLDLKANAELALLLTIISVTRNYAVRRAFNRGLQWKSC